MNTIDTIAAGGMTTWADVADTMTDADLRALESVLDGIRSVMEEA